MGAARLHDRNRHVALATVEQVARRILAIRIANVTRGRSRLQRKQSPCADEEIRRHGGTLLLSSFVESVRAGSKRRDEFWVPHPCGFQGAVFGWDSFRFFVASSSGRATTFDRPRLRLFKDALFFHEIINARAQMLVAAFAFLSIALTPPRRTVIPVSLLHFHTHCPLLTRSHLTNAL